MPWIAVPLFIIVCSDMVRRLACGHFGYVGWMAAACLAGPDYAIILSPLAVAAWSRCSATTWVGA
eukprot:6462098-Amphidinium_carterae.1